MATKTFEAYFASKGILPGEQLISGDQVLVLRSGTVFRGGGVGIHFGFANMEANAVDTVILTQNVWVPIAGTLVDAYSTPTLTFGSNEYTYIGPNELAPTMIRATVSALKVGGGGAESYQVGIFVNGSQVGLGMGFSATSTIFGHAQTNTPYAMQTGDVVDMRVRCTTGIIDLTVIEAQLEIE